MATANGHRHAKAAQADADPGAEPDASTDRPDEARILAACERKDLDELRDIAVAPGGFQSDYLRSRAWPVLLGFDADATSASPIETSSPWRHLPRHRDEEQVRLDVDRSFIYYPNYESPTQLKEKKAELSALITQVLREQPYLCYFQGYHDICQVLLLVLPPGLRAPAAARLSALRIRDFMLPTLAPALVQLRLIPDLVRAEDPALFAHLAQSEPHFALSDTLTMFAHNVQRYRDIARLFDALLAREQAFGLYVFACIVLGRRAELLAHGGGGDDDGPDMLYFVLSKLPPDLDLDAVVAGAARLFRRHPPESLPAWRRISSASTLRTTRDPRALARQTLPDGRAFFDAQVRQMQWAERRQRMLRAAWANRTVLLTILVGVGAVYLRKTSAWTSILAWMIRLGKG
ncbi:putative GTPase-activating protein gyp10 protein [Rosellinia necatrix]|uniref:Putative GTPase-activating protein gyp10 protein n=1 Tax=Rosellinia necatrix TaxID=77044 RepID=A0A1S7UIB9_ROSNE|nr:putative GTPase-activating protein gyp10 protein [Rosellinia necatrix]